jgi:magnesium transporter
VRAVLKSFRLVEGRIREAGEEPGQVLVYINPDEGEKRYLIDQLKVDEHTLNSALDPDELSRLEFEPEHVAIIFKRPKNYSAEDNLLFKVTSSGMFLFKNQLVVVVPEDVPLFEGRMFARVATLQDVMLKLIYRSIFHYLEHLKIITMMTDALEKKISASMENRYLLNLFTLEKSLVYYLNAINSNSMLIEKLKYGASKIGFSQEELEFLDDILIENGQCYKQAEIHSNILAGLMDARASIVNNNLNVLMKTLNIITIGIMVPTFVVSAFSMNVKMPFGFGATHPYAFWIIMSLALGSVVSFMVYWKKRKW